MSSSSGREDSNAALDSSEAVRLLTAKPKPPQQSFDEILENCRPETPEEKPTPKKRRWTLRRRHPETSPGWKPLSMTTPILTAVIIVTLAMAGIIEFLARKSQRQGGLAISPSLSDIPQYAIISAQYLPQVLAVCYSLVWSWIDLDVKRMQPWFEMSKANGALGRDSMLLDYPYMFVGVAPFMAAKRKHWPVSLSGFVMVLVLLAITPLVSSLLGTASIRQTTAHNVSRRSSSITVSDLRNFPEIDLETLLNSIAFLDRPFPAFTTSKAAYLPFYLDDPAIEIPTAYANWTAETSRLSAEINCWPAEISNIEYHRFEFSNGKDCKFTALLSGFDFQDMSYWMGSDYSLGAGSGQPGHHCPPNGDTTRQNLIWLSDVDLELVDGQLEVVNSTIIGMFCQPKYWKQDVLITINAANLEPDEASLQILAAPQLLEETEFNSSAFETFVRNGQPETPMDHPYWSGRPDLGILIGDRKLGEVSMVRSIAYAFARNSHTVDDLWNMDILENFFDDAHQYVFSSVASQLVANTTEFASRKATSTSFMSAIVVSRTISAVVEGFMLLVVFCSCFLVFFCRRLANNLHKNPSSIQRFGEVCQNNVDMLEYFKDCHVSSIDEGSLHQSAIADATFALTWNEVGRCPQMVILNDCRSYKPDRHRQDGEDFDPANPLILHRAVGLMFSLGVIGIMGTITYLKWAASKYDGLIRPYTNQDFQQILEGFTPTAVAALIEPFWTLVNRLLCALQPFKDLGRGQAKADRTISAAYTSIPPQFVIWRAWKSRHIVLLVICITVFFSNILTISLPALFREAEVEARVFQTSTSRISPAFNSSSQLIQLPYDNATAYRGLPVENHMWTAFVNATIGTSLMPWTSEEYFFQPWDLDLLPEYTLGSQSFVVSTQGFGATLDCTAMPRSIQETTRSLPDELPDDCSPLNISLTSLLDFGKIQGSHTLPYAIEYGRVCSTSMTFGWARLAKPDQLPEPKQPTESARYYYTYPPNFSIDSHMQASFVICKTIFQTGMFEVRVDLGGRVLAYKNTSALAEHLDLETSNKDIERIISKVNSFTVTNAGWHVDNMTTDWFNHFILLFTGSRKHLDPEEPPPDADDMMRHLSKAYQVFFSSFLGAWYGVDLFEAPVTDSSTEATIDILETRLFIDQPAFIISMVLLAINVIVAVMLYGQSGALLLPRLPTSIGSVIAYIAPSRMMEGTSFHSLRNDKTFSFGRYTSRDGKAQIGIEVDPYVEPIPMASAAGRWGLKRRVRFSNEDTYESIHNREERGNDAQDDVRDEGHGWGT